MITPACCMGQLPPHRLASRFESQGSPSTAGVLTLGYLLAEWLNRLTVRARVPLVRREVSQARAIYLFRPWRIAPAFQQGLLKTASATARLGRSLFAHSVGRGLHQTVDCDLIGIVVVPETLCCRAATRLRLPDVASKKSAVAVSRRICLSADDFRAS